MEIEQVIKDTQETLDNSDCLNVKLIAYNKEEATQVEKVFLGKGYDCDINRTRLNIPVEYHLSIKNNLNEEQIQELIDET